MSLRCAVVAVLAGILGSAASPLAPAGSGAAHAGAGQSTYDQEKAAFASAKELGTADAWNAFLSAYPSGFHADLARAYLKKLEQGPAAAGAPPSGPSTSGATEAPIVPSSARAGELSCSEQSTLRSQHSREPTKITFINRSGMYRAFLWIDFKGALQSYGGVNPGEQITFDTFRTHPWVIATGPGDCLQIFMPAAEPSVVELQRLPADDGKPLSRVEKKIEKKVEKKPLVCGKNYKLRNGKCVLIQNCGANAYRSAEGDCYCNKGYKMQNGKCVWPQDKQGFEIAPWKKSGCKTWQAECNQGNGKSCMKVEENCQVN
jgi:hypothetical protein